MATVSFIESDNSRAPLNCTSDMLKTLFTYHRTYCSCGMTEKKKKIENLETMKRREGLTWVYRG
jgi:hypothetical protein